MSRRAGDRHELWTTLEYNGGQRFATGGFLGAVTQSTSVRAEDDSESLTVSFPRTELGAASVREYMAVRTWRDDDTWEEWPALGKLTIRTGAEGIVTVVCKPILYLLSTTGIVTEWQTMPASGLPQFDVGVANLTAREVLQTYLIDHPVISAQLPWLRIGTVDPEILIDVSWDKQNARGVVNAVLAALAAKDAPCLLDLVKNETTRTYDLTLLEDDA